MNTEVFIKAVEFMDLSQRFYVSLGAVFLSVLFLVLFVGLSMTGKSRGGPLDRLGRYFSHVEGQGQVVSPFMERAILPLWRKVASLVIRISPRGIIEAAKQRLVLAGSPEKVGVDVYLFTKILFPFGMLFLTILVYLFLSPTLLLRVILIGSIPLSYFLPDFYLRRRIEKRQTEIKKALPDALDMLVISVEAGMGFDQALGKVAGNIKGALAEELNKMLQEMGAGLARRDALRNLARRTDVADLNAFVAAMIQGDIFGVSIGRVLRVQASDMRSRRRQHAEEMGAKTPVKLVLPLILCIFPALLTVILGPAVIRIYYTLIQRL